MQNDSRFPLQQGDPRPLSASNDGGKGNGGDAEQFSVSAPTVSLPKGGGAVRGIGEKFAANPVTGTGSMSVPIALSPGRGGFGPELALSYDSGAGEGVYGMGWNLALPSISRKTDKGLPRYMDAQESDVFVLSGAEDLVPVLNKLGERVVEHAHFGSQKYHVHLYRPRVEGLFARIERWVVGDQLETAFWRTISRDNTTTWYGTDEESRIFDPGDTAHTHIYQWLICQTSDDKGNLAVYRYIKEDRRNVDIGAWFSFDRFRVTRASASGPQFSAVWRACLAI